MDALLLSGGIKKTGSLRNVRIRRGVREYTVDLYAVLTDGGAGSSLSLADGDRIVVPGVGRSVAVTGLVRRPGIFELPGNQPSLSVRALLSLAGGQEVRGRYRLSLMRILPDGNSDLSSTGETAPVRDSEILFVQLGADQVTSQATLSGGTGLAGQYPVIGGTKLSDVLKSGGALGANPYTLLGVISRRDSRNLLRTVMAFTPVAILNGGEDEQLQSGDIVRPLSVREERLIDATVHRFLQVQNQRQEQIRNPAIAPNIPTTVTTTSPNGQTTRTTRPANEAGNMPLSASDLAAAQNYDIQVIGNQSQTQLSAVSNGQPLPPFYPVRPDLYPQRQNLGPQQAGQAQTYQPNGGEQNFDQNGQAQSQLQGQVYGQGGSVPSQAPLQGMPSPSGPQNSQQFRNYSPPYNDGMAANFEDQAIRPNIYPANREVQTFNALAQQLEVDPLILINFFIDHQVTLDGAVRGPGTYLAGPNTVLQDLVAAAGGTVNWADESGVELISTLVDAQNGRAQTQRVQLPLRQGMFASYVVKPRDQFRFNQVFADAGFGSVTVQGEVRSAGIYRITRGERLSQLLMRAGGLTSTAYPYGTVFLRKSAADAERNSYVRAASEIEDQLVVAMTRVGSDKISPDTFAAMQSFVTDLRNQKAVGRLSIQADPSVLAAHSELDPLLEPGDVVYVPQRPSTISVLGQVMQAGSYPYRAGISVEEYVEQAGGHTKLADRSATYVVLPDGSARKVEKSWLSFDSDKLPPGSAIVVPRDVTPLDTRQTIIDITQIFSQLAVSIASVAVISR